MWVTWEIGRTTAQAGAGARAAHPPARPDLSRAVVITGESTRVARPARTAGSRRRAAAWAVVAAVAAVALFAAYLGQSRTVSVGSDGASQALQAWDMLHGNPLLHGWWVTDVSFYTTELPQYVLLELVRGLTVDVMHVGGAMTYTLLVLAAAFLARGRARGRAGLTRALLAAGIMLAPQLGAGAGTLVLSPDHTGTAVPVLLVWLLIDRCPARWYVPVLVWLALAWVAVADTLTLFVAVAPLALVCAARVALGVLRNSESLREHWYELALLAAAILAIPTELAVTAIIRALGGWQVNALSTALADRRAAGRKRAAHRRGPARVVRRERVRGRGDRLGPGRHVRDRPPGRRRARRRRGDRGGDVGRPRAP